MIIAQPFKYILKIPKYAILKWNFKVCELYLNKNKGRKLEVVDSMHNKLQL